jgi:hypothetical protein
MSNVKSIGVSTMLLFLTSCYTHLRVPYPLNAANKQIIKNVYTTSKTFCPGNPSLTTRIMECPVIRNEKDTTNYLALQGGAFFLNLSLQAKASRNEKHFIITVESGGFIRFLNLNPDRSERKSFLKELKNALKKNNTR